jgi:hypothetical protein
MLTPSHYIGRDDIIRTFLWEDGAKDLDPTMLLLPPDAQPLVVKAPGFRSTAIDFGDPRKSVIHCRLQIGDAYRLRIQAAVVPEHWRLIVLPTSTTDNEYYHSDYRKLCCPVMQDVTGGGDFVFYGNWETSRARDASDGAWLPTVSVKGGVLRHQAGEASYGYLAGVTVSLPIFSRGQGVRAEADARLKLARARVSAREREARLEVTRAQVELELAQRELVRFQSATRGRIERLEKAAQSSYREGRRTVLELLDAQRTRSAVQERLLELALAAKRAEIALRAARGEFE